MIYLYLCNFDIIIRVEICVGHFEENDFKFDRMLAWYEMGSGSSH